MNKILALGANATQIAKASKKYMAKQPVFGLVIAESNPEVFTKSGLFNKKAMVRAINDEFTRRGKINKADKIISESDLLSAGFEKDIDLETLLNKIITKMPDENYPNNLAQAIKKVGSYRKFLSKEGCSKWLNEHFLPMAQEKGKGKIGLLKTISNTARKMS